MSDSETIKSKNEAPQRGDTNQGQRAFNFAQPLQTFQWTKNAQAGAHVELNFGRDAGAAKIKEASTAGTRNYVFAHFMVGNTYFALQPYTIDDWLADIKLAASQDIDGFVLNVGAEDWQRQRSADCFAASKRLPDSTNFKFFFSFDMTSILGNSTGDVQLFRNYMSANYQSPRMFKHPRNGNIVVSTFSGESSTFGQGSTENGWAYLKSELNKIFPIYFIPSFFINPARYPGISAMDGAFNWNGGWPIQLKAGMSRSEIENAQLDSDLKHLQYLTGGRTFMAAVSPWFFTHYGPDTWNKNWIYRGDDWLFVKRWQQLISMRDRIDMVQIISWNDYGESHYIGPIKGAQPNSQAWVDGYPHTAWLYLNRYFTKAFQTGTYPAITKDQIFMWARPHPKNSTSADAVPRPTNWQLTDDTAWMVVFATAEASIEAYTTDDTKVTFSVKAGMTKLSFPLKADGGMKASMIRNYRVVAECNPIAYRFESRPGVYNFNACVAMSP
ncbi:glycoside hydrolase family 71 protein [Flammula alnicola]|nr:glycoside hydrolase family 71 protein [Flammula alnicola]